MVFLILPRSPAALSAIWSWKSGSEANRVARINHQFGDISFVPTSWIIGNLRWKIPQSWVDCDRSSLRICGLVDCSFKSRLPIREGKDGLVFDSELQAVKAGILTLAGEKLLVRSFFNDTPLVQDNNAVGEPHRR